MSPNDQKHYKHPVFWLFWTISPKIMGLMICLGAYFYALILGHTSRLLAGLCVPFWIHLGMLQWLQNGQKQHKKNCFLVVLDHFFCKNEPNDLVRGLFLCLDIWSYIRPTCAPLSTFLGPFGGAQIAQKWLKQQDKKLFCSCLRPFLLKQWA
jgi:hypothetical protein